MRLLFATAGERNEVEKYGAVEGQKETINRLEELLTQLMSTLKN